MRGQRVSSCSVASQNMSQIIEKRSLDDIRQEPLKPMKAIVRTQYGSPDVLQFKEVEKPIPDETRGVLVKVYASSANPLDWHTMRASPFIVRTSEGLRKPKTPRSEEHTSELQSHSNISYAV